MNIAIVLSAGGTLFALQLGKSRNSTVSVSLCVGPQFEKRLSAVLQWYLVRFPLLVRLSHGLAMA